MVSVSGMLIYILSQWVIINEWSEWHHLWWGLSGFFGTSGVLMYAYLSQSVPKSLVGRVNTSFKFVCLCSGFCVSVGFRDRD